MSENIPESIPTSQDPRSRRPIKRRALTSNGQQAQEVEALFANPDREIVFPNPSTAKSKQLPPPPEIVQNVQGSSAGAGSGEFHVYKASRRREYERLRLMEEESKQEKDEVEFEAKREERQKKDDAKTRKNREKREKAKKRKANGGKPGDNDNGERTQAGVNGSHDGVKNADTIDGKKDDHSQETSLDDEAKLIGVADMPDGAGIIIHDDD